MNNVIVKTVFIGILATLCGSGIYVFLFSGFFDSLTLEKVQMPEITPDTPEEIAVVIVEEPDIRPEFEELLNNFIHQISVKVRDYRAQRKVLIDLVNIKNLEKKIYIEENRQIAGVIVLNLHTRMASIMLIFKDTEDRVLELIENHTEASRKVILDEWADLKSQKATPYVEFFSIEGDIIQSYEELMTFYYIKQNKYKVNVGNNSITFENPVDELERRVILDRIADLAKKQTMVFGK